MTNIVAITAANAKRWQVAKIVPKRQAEVNGVVLHWSRRLQRFAIRRSPRPSGARPTAGQSSPSSMSGRLVGAATASWGRATGWRMSRSTSLVGEGPRSSGRWSGA